MKQIFVDTSAWYAYINKNDPAHQRVRDCLRSFSGRLLTSNFIFDETVTLCTYRLGHAVAAKVGSFLLNPVSVSLIHLNTEDEQNAWKLFLNRPDKDYKSVQEKRCTIKVPPVI